MHSDQICFSSIVEYHVFVYTCVSLNRTTSLEQLKNNNKYENHISPIRWLTATTKRKLTMHRITVIKLTVFTILSLFASVRTLIPSKCSLLSFP